MGFIAGRKKREMEFSTKMAVVEFHIYLVSYFTSDVFLESVASYTFGKKFITCENGTVSAAEQLSTNLFDKVWLVRYGNHVHHLQECLQF